MKFRANLVIGGVLSVVPVIVAVAAPWLSHTHPFMDANLMNAELPPDGEFWFGTDKQGRDIYSRVCWGAQISVTVGLVSQVINSAIGTALGLMWVIQNAGMAGANIAAGWLNDNAAASASNPAGYQPMMLFFGIMSALGFVCAMILWLTAGRARHEAVTHAP